MKKYLFTITFIVASIATIFVWFNQVSADASSNNLSDISVGGRSIENGETIKVYGFQPTIAGSTDSSSTMTISLTASGQSPIIANLSADGAGDFSFTPSSELEKATYILSIISTDPHGNVTAFSGSLVMKQNHVIGALIKKSSNDTVYLVQSGTKVPIPSATAFLSHNFPWAEVLTLNSDEVDFYSNGSHLTIRNGTLVKSSSSDTVYVIQGTSKRPFPTADIFLDLGYGWDSIYTSSDAELSGYTTGSLMAASSQHLPGTLIKLSSSDTVYLLEQDGSLKTRGVPSASVFLSQGFRWEDIIAVTQTELDTYTDGDLLVFRDGTLVKATSGDTVYVIESEKKRAFVSGTVFTGLGYDWSNVLEVPSTELTAITAGDNII
ncbi:hypothetical protein KC571_03805 [candidate division WWE3 bacterium]|uniref:Uncharacterized protein n=1 Tax=candidate division WWE3 bacterium TaxID=2053526 RepID=A0A955LHE4_UNCKA|nr:hypothetical protein [candidate division WWE3 bacterium]